MNEALTVESVRKAVASMKLANPRSAEDKAEDILFEDGDYFEVWNSKGGLVVAGVWPEGMKGIR